MGSKHRKGRERVSPSELVQLSILLLIFYWTDYCYAKILEKSRDLWLTGHAIQQMYIHENSS